jgi:putative ABC transport system permease protein
VYRHDVFKIPLRRGRVVTERDTSGAPLIVIISEKLARAYRPTGDALGQQLLIGKGMGPQFVEGPREIVGIVGDVREELDANPEPMMYVPTAQVTNGMTQLLNERLPMAWAVRTIGDPATLVAAIQTELRQASDGIKPSNIRSMDELRRSSTARATFNMLLLTIFGCAALLLATIGVYGLMAYSVQQRTQEIGVRLALGAASPQVRNMVIAQGMAIALVGVGIGVGAALGLTRLMESVLFGVTPRDPRVFIAVAALLSVAALAGIWLPARRAARVDPVIALRAE